jgi:hypothetical protein
MGALVEAIALVERRLRLLEDSTSPLGCVAEGQLRIALLAMQRSAELLGEAAPKAACKSFVDWEGRCNDDDCPVHGPEGA